MKMNVKRKPIGNDTRLVLVKGSDITTLSDETFEQITDMDATAAAV